MKQVVINRDKLNEKEIRQLSKSHDTVIEDEVIKVMVDDGDDSVESQYETLDEINE